MSEDKLLEKEPTYRITYLVECHEKPVPRSEISEAAGACDSMVVCQVFDSAGGHDHEYGFSSVNGVDGKPLSPTQMFQIWTIYAQFLAEELPDGGPRDLCLEVKKVIAKAKDRMRQDKN